MSVAIMTDTNSGLTPEQAKELGVYLLPMPILIDGNAYYEHQSITPKEFYEKMHILDPNGQEVAYHNQIPDYAPAEK